MTAVADEMILKGFFVELTIKKRYRFVKDDDREIGIPRSKVFTNTLKTAVPFQFSPRQVGVDYL